MENGNGNGWIKLHRKLLDWEWYSDPITKAVFLHCIFKANWQDKKWHGVTIKRGQFITSYPSLAKDLGISIRNARTAITKLKSTGELTGQSTNSYTTITVVRYREYQLREAAETGQPTGQPTGDRQASDRPPTATKEVKETKEGEDGSANFPTGKYNTPESITERETNYVAYTTGERVERVNETWTMLRLDAEAKGTKYNNFLAALEKWVRSDQSKRRKRVAII